MKTVRVWIAVAVNKEGMWSAYGDSAHDEQECADEALEANMEEGHIVFIEADVPLPPESVIVEGTVAE